MLSLDKDRIRRCVSWLGEQPWLRSACPRVWDTPARTPVPPALPGGELESSAQLNCELENIQFYLAI